MSDETTIPMSSLNGTERMRARADGNGDTLKKWPVQGIDPDDITALTAAISGIDPSATLSAILAKLIASPATSGKQDTVIASLATVISGLASVDGHVDGVESLLGSIQGLLGAPLTVSGPLTNAQLAAAGLATQATLASVLAALQAATPAGENHLGEVGGKAVVSAQDVASSAATYVSGRCIGGLLTFPGFGRVSGGTGLLQMASIMSKTAQTAPVDLVVFHTPPAASTVADNTALAIAAADWDKIIDVIPVTDWRSLGTPSFGRATALAVSYKAASGSTSIYAVPVARGSITLASTSDWKVALKALLD